jgi:gp32 DNA binding protein like
MSDFDALKKASADFDGLLKEVERITSPQTTWEEDKRFWKPEVDKAGNALAVIRFLPGPAVDGKNAKPFVRYFDHHFQDPITKKWYIEKSRTSLPDPSDPEGRKTLPDPLTEFNSRLWKMSDDPASPSRRQASRQKRVLHYVSNILVVSDPKHPENEGQVFLYKYGKKIFEKHTQLMKPDLESEKKINPFHITEGADFKLKVTRKMVDVAGKTEKVPMPNYDDSTFLPPGPIAINGRQLSEEELIAIWKASYSLQEFIAPESFKSYDDLKRKLEDVVPNAAPDWNGSYAAAAPRPVPPARQKQVEDLPWDNTDDADGDLSMFEGLTG